MNQDNSHHDRKVDPGDIKVPSGYMVEVFAKDLQLLSIWFLLQIMKYT
ncbi:MAG TPA: hypothetical protein VEF53_12695 [Patescibacteria group bacterium]|nr:hypothetical protein [Patescibacteria group bacterium]